MIYTGTLPIQEYLLSVQFAKDCINSNLDKYHRRKQSDPIKIYNDILIGKVAEFFVFLNVSGCSYPDLKVYASADKSFDADLVKDKYKIHVKSCRKDSAFEHSWVFQPEDDLVANPSRYDVLALCIVDGGNVECMTIPAKEVEYKDPVKNLNKKVIYKKDLEWKI